MSKYKIWFQGATDRVHMAPYISKVEAHLKSVLDPDFSATFHTTTPPATTTLVDLEKSHDDGGIFHLSRDVAPAAAQVDLDSFRYFIVAKATVASFFSLQTFELTYFA